MKLECPVVKDLYILYKENELSAETKYAVEEHLETCKDCGRVYENGEGFDDMIKKDTEEQPSTRLDEKMMMKLKISRLKVVVVFIALVFLISIYYNYSQSRYNLLYDVSQAEESLHKMSFNIGDIKNSSTPPLNFTEDIDSLNNQQNNAIRRDLNFIEASRLNSAPNELFMNFKVYELYNILKIRYQNGTFSERDEKAYLLLKQYMEDTTKLLSDERQRLNGLYDGRKLMALVTPMDVYSIAQSYDRLNMLSLLYAQYDKFPDEISHLSQDDMKKRLQYVFNLDNAEINISSNMETSIMLNGDADFNIKAGNLYYHGTMDAYTGNIKDLIYSSSDTSGDLKPVESIKGELKSLLGRLYGKDQDFIIDDMGINYRFSSNTDIKLYSFIVTPVINGLKVNYKILIYYDARSGEPYSILNLSGYSFTLPGNNVDTSMNITKEQGLKILSASGSGNFKYSDTIIIRSKLSGRYVPVYEYVDKDNKAYINSAGKLEFTY